ncbi:MAG TPA: hypothetical protein PLL92_10360 [Alicycliphilus sp.]|nr:hypothetical protein [Alicycliphilus sp.]
MATNKTTKGMPPRDPKTLQVQTTEQDISKALAAVVTDGALTAVTLQGCVNVGPNLDVTELVEAMKKAGDETVAGNFGRIERLLTNQLLTLDAMFNNLAQRSARQETFKGIETLMRLALKAQTQARATAETLSVMKNPMPYIRQANIAHGHQQVNNGMQPPIAGAGNLQSEPDKLLEQQHGNYLDTRAQTAAGRIDPALETVGAKHRAHQPRGKSRSVT